MKKLLFLLILGLFLASYSVNSATKCKVTDIVLTKADKNGNLHLIDSLPDAFNGNLTGFTKANANEYEEYPIKLYFSLGRPEKILMPNSRCDDPIKRNTNPDLKLRHNNVREYTSMETDIDMFQDGTFRSRRVWHSSNTTELNIIFVEFTIGTCK